MPAQEFIRVFKGFFSITAIPKYIHNSGLLGHVYELLTILKNKYFPAFKKNEGDPSVLRFSVTRNRPYFQIR